MKNNYAYTHGGLFHADDVFAWAALKVAGFEFTLKRVNRVPADINDNDIIFDIGGGKFDHHQPNAEVRENGIPYAAFGLIVREFHEAMGLSDNAYHLLDSTFIQKMDAYDNGATEESNPLSNAISCFYPVWDEDGSEAAQMEAFEAAAEVALMILCKEIASVNAKVRAYDYADSLKKTVFHHTVFMDRFAPISGIYKDDSEIHWLAFPSNRGGWNISSVPGVNVRNKALMPEQFRGSSNLPKGMTFCHPGGFIAAFETEQDARNFAEWYL